MTSKRQQILDAIYQSGEHGIRTEEINQLVDIDRHRLNVDLWFFRSAGKIKSVKISNLAVHVAMGVSIEKAKAALEADVAALRVVQYERHLERQRESRARKAAERGSKPLSEAQLAQKRAAAENGRKRLKELGINPPKPVKKVKLLTKKTAAINLLAEKVKREKPSTMTEPKKKQPPTITWGDVPVQKIAHRPGRYEVLEVQGMFKSLGPGRYVDEPASCAARAIA